MRFSLTSDPNPASQRLLMLPVFFLLTLLPLAGSAADSYVPQSAAEVVATLPETVVALATQARQRESQMASATTDARRAALLMQQILGAYRLAVTQDSPRAYGYTLNLLDDWPSSQATPYFLYLIKADVLQHGHEFGAARQELNRILSNDPGNSQALLMLSQISLVMADYPAVDEACAGLHRYGFEVMALNCQSQLEGVTGSAEAALLRTEFALDSRDLSEAQRLELFITAATIAHRLGRDELAEVHYHAALQLAPGNRYVLTNLSDLFAEQQRYRDIIGLLETHDNMANEYELQLTLLNARLRAGAITEDDAALAELNSALDVMRARGEDQPHKLIAQHALRLTGNYELAHEAALANWQIQKEPSDVLLLARAASLVGQVETLDMLRDWQQETGLQDHRLANLLSSGEGL